MVVFFFVVFISGYSGYWVAEEKSETKQFALVEIGCFEWQVCPNRRLHTIESNPSTCVPQFSSCSCPSKGLLPENLTKDSEIDKKDNRELFLLVGDCWLIEQW